ncbi:uncharacterized protein NPIL_127871 [Nephila pilipes]|uniref:Uncharacterized protein n=1 Tax=Nephila pilipes TaxID=299642 RepID=A0A8X6NR82_NEPPI|nr:uncharacterized protein NPIL_127871 [Nephila pilipes]
MVSSVLTNRDRNIFFFFHCTKEAFWNFMSKNKEIKLGVLNRLAQLKENEEKEVKNPRRPPLEKLNTSEEIQKWIPSIKDDLEFYLYKAQVVHYSEDHIKLCRQKIQHLEGLYKAFVRKLTELSPRKLDAVPWTNRAYKRKRDESPESTQRGEEFIPIPTPILKHGKASHKEEICIPVPNLLLMDKPLTFNFDNKETFSNSSNIYNNDYSNNIIEDSSCISIGLKSKQGLETPVQHLKSIPSLYRNKTRGTETLPIVLVELRNKDRINLHFADQRKNTQNIRIYNAALKTRKLKKEKREEAYFSSGDI